MGLKEDATEKRMKEGGVWGKGIGSKCQMGSWRITLGLVIMPRRAQRQAAMWMNDHTYLPCLSLLLFPILRLCLSLSHAHTQAATPRAPTAISGPLHEINWPPTKDSKSQITSGEKWAIAIIVTECVEDLFKYVIPKHGLSPRAPRIVGYLLTITN